MDTAVDTRHGICFTVIVNHIIISVFSFFLVFLAFKWAYNNDTGIVILFTVLAILYYSGIYSYAATQPKIDMRDKKKYDWLMPLKLGGLSSLIIFLLTGVQFIIYNFSPVVSTLYGIFAKFFNYMFFYFLYGRNGDCRNVTALIILMIIPIVVAYLGYFLGAKKFSIGKLYTKIVYKDAE